MGAQLRLRRAPEIIHQGYRELTDDVLNLVDYEVGEMQTNLSKGTLLAATSEMVVSMQQPSPKSLPGKSTQRRQCVDKAT